MFQAEMPAAYTPLPLPNAPPYPAARFKHRYLEVQWLADAIELRVAGYAQVATSMGSDEPTALRAALFREGLPSVPELYESLTRHFHIANVRMKQDAEEHCPCRSRPVARCCLSKCWTSLQRTRDHGLSEGSLCFAGAHGVSCGQ